MQILVHVCSDYHLSENITGIAVRKRKPVRKWTMNLIRTPWGWWWRLRHTATDAGALIHILILNLALEYQTCWVPSRVVSEVYPFKDYNSFLR